ncbi:hypothetical protein SAMN05444350_12629 [Bacteroides stercorirosoris]|jgi:hypothetical protein|uniref:Uncharacterized protein n=1 Tax=Bacteroides stercorirosoris TaxID=871324 RepID=A0A1M6J1V0_9BACE|nr:hypothetical protein SAMN05444350_12629 [Bacteroides stercorirosoris]
MVAISCQELIYVLLTMCLSNGVMYAAYHLECHTSPPGMPHVIIRNATSQ